MFCRDCRATSLIWIDNADESYVVLLSGKARMNRTKMP